MDLPYQQVMFEDSRVFGIARLILDIWDYTKKDTIIIDTYDTLMDPAVSFNVVALEQKIVERRIYEGPIFFLSVRRRIYRHLQGTS